MAFDLNKALQAIAANHDEVEWQKFQDEQRAKLADLPLDNTSFGRRQVELALRQIADGADPEFEMERMAEGYALMGDYRSASDISDKYLPIWEAIQKDPDEKCDCPRMSGQGTKSYPLQTVIQKFNYNGHETNLIRCSQCGFLNTNA